MALSTPLIPRMISCLPRLVRVGSALHDSLAADSLLTARLLVPIESHTKA